MPVLIIGEAERTRIAEMVAYAKANPIPLAVLRAGSLGEADSRTIKLSDRKPGFERPPSQHIILPGGYRCAFSVEEQPAGFCSHLSVSVEGRAKKGAMPNPFAVKMIAEEFGVPFPADRMWQEEFDPGEFAINLLSLYEPTKEGQA